MQPVITADQMKEIDLLTTEIHQTPSLRLMQSAAAACFKAIATHFSDNLSGKKAQILCGPGNNGGDGAALALELSRAGVRTEVVLFGSLQNTKGDAQTNFQAVNSLAGFEAGSESIENRGRLSFTECNTLAAWESIAPQSETYDVIVDALFGTGLSRPLAGVFVQVVQHLAMIRRQREWLAPPLILSIDLPSGLDADLATLIGEAVQADITVTFTAPKMANVMPPASHLNGQLIVADIGSPASLVDAAQSNVFVVEEADVRQWLSDTRYTPDSFKNTHGHALVIAGSRGYTGAAVLCGNAAMRSGAGLVTIATPVSAQSAIASSVMPEVMTQALAETDRGAVSDDAIEHALQLAAKADVIAIGPGLSAEDERTRRFVFSMVQQRRTPLVIDADALNCLAHAGGWPAELQGSTAAPLIITPHAGEMLRLLGTTNKAALDDRLVVARDFAIKHQLILVLKGARSLIAAPDGRVFLNPTGNAGLGTAGAGDTLTGIIAGFIAQAGATLKEKADVLLATIAALYVGGLAGDFAARELGMRTMVASDIREHLSEAICSLDVEGEIPLEERISAVS
ncbi:MAG TPA: NAD(P)H-hydrate dehydratase [Pyrinomonadaceae bacterium]|nr:NAD(P)H-hydrate dehydratase [Pyrinomonadaceae bacterium]